MKRETARVLGTIAAGRAPVRETWYELRVWVHQPGGSWFRIEGLEDEYYSTVDEAKDEITALKGERGELDFSKVFIAKMTAEEVLL
jgi:hypothetical protein